MFMHAMCIYHSLICTKNQVSMKLNVKANSSRKAPTLLSVAAGIPRITLGIFLPEARSQNGGASFGEGCA
jgi:hypothetical protein